jgi:dynein heavy chain
MLRVCILRLLVPQDLDTYNKAAVAIAKKYFAINDIDDYYKKKDARPLIFCHFARGLSNKTYDEVRTLPAAQPVVLQLALPHRIAVFTFKSRLMGACRRA